jgi:hypothetical protein
MEIQINDQAVEQIARRVAELLAAENAQAPARMVDAATLARELGVERDWVYEHADQLGVVRLGGPKGRLRFDRSGVAARLGLITDRGPKRTPTRMPQGRQLKSPARSSGRAAQPRPRPDTGR